MNDLSLIQRTTCFVCREDDLVDEIIRMNSNGWRITSARRNSAKVHEFVVQAIFVGSDLKKNPQMDVYEGSQYF